MFPTVQVGDMGAAVDAGHSHKRGRGGEHDAPVRQIAGIVVVDVRLADERQFAQSRAINLHLEDLPPSVGAGHGEEQFLGVEMQVDIAHESATVRPQERPQVALGTHGREHRQTVVVSGGRKLELLCQLAGKPRLPLPARPATSGRNPRAGLPAVPPAGYCGNHRRCAAVGIRAIDPDQGRPAATHRGRFSSFAVAAGNSDLWGNDRQTSHSSPRRRVRAPATRPLRYPLGPAVPPPTGAHGNGCHRSADERVFNAITRQPLQIGPMSIRAHCCSGPIASPSPDHSARGQLRIRRADPRRRLLRARAAVHLSVRPVPAKSAKAG